MHCTVKQYTTNHNTKQYTTDHNTKQYTTDHNTKQYTTDHNTEQYTTDHNTKHTQYTAFPEMPPVAQLIMIFPTILCNLQFIRMSFNALSKQEQSKSTLIQFLKIHCTVFPPYSQALLKWPFPSNFPITNLFKITFTPMHATFLTHYATALWYPTISQTL